MNYKLLNHLQVVKNNPGKYKLFLVYDSDSFDERSPEGRAMPSHNHKLKRNSLISSGLVYTQLPLGITLMVVGQMQIVMTEGFGDLRVNTSMGKGGHQSMKIQLGATSLERIQQLDRENMDRWFRQVCAAECHHF